MLPGLGKNRTVRSPLCSSPSPRKQVPYSAPGQTALCCCHFRLSERVTGLSSARSPTSLRGRANSSPRPMAPVSDSADPLSPPSERRRKCRSYIRAFPPGLHLSSSEPLPQSLNICLSSGESLGIGTSKTKVKTPSQPLGVNPQSTKPQSPHL